MYQAKLVYCPVGSVLYNQGYNQGNTYNFYDYELVLGPYSKEAIEKEIAEINEEKAKLDTEIGDLESKIQWMEEVGVTEFDEDEYKVWKTLSILEDDSVGKLVKMKEIAKMIKG
jgi:predicted  nucleic acid-binding Zn-ribbon protein